MGKVHHHWGHSPHGKLESKRQSSVQSHVCAFNFFCILDCRLQCRRWTIMSSIARVSNELYHPTQTILATQRGCIQLILRCSILLGEFIYLCGGQLVLPQKYLHVYVPICHSQVSRAYNLHYVSGVITHPCHRCLLQTILHVLDRQFT